MYDRCLSCYSSLGANTAVDAFPVGRRLAFDGERGRLWVVCRRCGQWNLSPLEERWEAIEACERLYRDTRLRVSGNEIGLARLREGLELVRIGRPQRPEFAAWRYGDRFGRRRRQVLAVGAGAVVVAGGIATVGIASGFLAGVTMGGVLNLGGIVANALQFGSLRRRPIRLTLADGRRIVLPTDCSVRLVTAPGAEGWGIAIPLVLEDEVPHGRGLSLVDVRPRPTSVLTGDDARLVVGRVLPRVNRTGAPERRVRDAVRLIEDAGTPERWLATLPAAIPGWNRAQSWGDTGEVQALPAPVRLALEMAAHEETERAALEGELTALEHAWRDAEEIAAIADDLLLPADVTARIEVEKSRGDE